MYAHVDLDIKVRLASAFPDPLLPLTRTIDPLYWFFSPAAQALRPVSQGTLVKKCGYIGAQPS